ncbi:MAG: hypothetical protein AABY15_03785 [Nanoarchaeota archaeon]
MKSQSSTEFMIFVGIAIIIMISYFAIAHTYLNLTYKQKDIISGQDLAKKIKNEINLASRVEDNYERTFQLPYKIGDKDFTVHLELREVSITIDGLDYSELLTININKIDLLPGDLVTVSRTNNIVTVSKQVQGGSPV